VRRGKRELSVGGCLLAQKGWVRRAFLDLCSETSEYVSSVDDIFAGGDWG